MTHTVRILDRLLTVDEDTGCAVLANTPELSDAPDTASPFDADRAPSICALTSVSPVSALSDVTCPVVLFDTENRENAALLCRCAMERGLDTTVLLTSDGTFDCDRLLVPEERYEAYRHAAPTVGVRLSYDIRTPVLLSRVRTWIEAGVTLIDAYPADPRACREGELDALKEELFRTADYLYRLKQDDGTTVAFLPFSLQGRGAKHGIGAHRNIRCHTCSHRMLCGGRRLSFGDCEYKRTTADCAALLSV